MSDESAAAQDLYEQAYESWYAQKPKATLRLATDALLIEPDHGSARLLAGYALRHLREDHAAIGVLTSLAMLPVADALDAEIHRRASRLVHRSADRFTRDQVSLGFMPFAFAPEQVPARWQLLVSHAWELGVPLTDTLSLRFDAQHRWVTDNNDANGWRLAPMLVVSRVRGPNAMDIGIGPSTWIATGVWWRSGVHVYEGVRIAAGTDARVGRRWSFRVEAGLQPHFTGRTLWWYAMPMDARFGLAWWFGKPDGSQF